MRRRAPMVEASTQTSPNLVEVLPSHRFDEAALVHYLAEHLPGFSKGCVVRQFHGGQSNPTFHLETPGGAYVLRKKPAGKLLPSAHAVERQGVRRRRSGLTDFADRRHVGFGAGPRLD